MNDAIEKVEEIVSLRDDEGRRRVYTPNKLDEIQKESLALITQMSKSQEGITDQLKAVGETMHQVALLVTAMHETTKVPLPRKSK